MKIRLLKTITFLVYLSPLSILCAQDLKVDPFTGLSTKVCIEEILDQRASLQLGEIYLSTSQKTPLQLRLTKGDRAQQPCVNSCRFIFQVKNISLTENKKGDRLYEGEISIKVEFLNYFDGDTILVYQGESNSSYQRNLSYNTTKQLEKLIANSFVSIHERFEAYLDDNRVNLECSNTGSKIVVLPFKSRSNTDTLYYNSRKITWNDFKGRENYGSKFSAAIYPNIELESSFRLENGTLIAQVQPGVYMVPGLSWVKPNTNTPYALAHEQLHFDIAYLAALRMVKAVKEIQARTMKDLQSLVQFQYLESYRYMNKLQSTYDAETDHSRNRMQQLRWDNQVKKQIELLENQVLKD